MKTCNHIYARACMRAAENAASPILAHLTVPSRISSLSFLLFLSFSFFLSLSLSLQRLGTH